MDVTEKAKAEREGGRAKGHLMNMLQKGPHLLSETSTTSYSVTRKSIRARIQARVEKGGFRVLPFLLSRAVQWGNNALSHCSYRAPLKGSGQVW